MTETRAQILTRAGQLKLRAMSMKCLGDEESRSEAAALFREAAGEELRAFQMLPAPTPAEVLAVEIETCWLLLEGLDPEGAMARRAQLMEAAATVPAEVSRAMMVRLRPRIAREPWA